MFLKSSNILIFGHILRVRYFGLVCKTTPLPVPYPRPCSPLPSVGTDCFCNPGGGWTRGTNFLCLVRFSFHDLIFWDIFYFGRFLHPRALQALARLEGAERPRSPDLPDDKAVVRAITLSTPADRFVFFKKNTHFSKGILFIIFLGIPFTQSISESFSIHKTSAKMDWMPFFLVEMFYVWFVFLTMQKGDIELYGEKNEERLEHRHDEKISHRELRPGVGSVGQRRGMRCKRRGRMRRSSPPVCLVRKFRTTKVHNSSSPCRIQNACRSNLVPHADFLDRSAE